MENVVSDGNSTMVVSNEGVELSQLLKTVEDKYDGVVVDIQNILNDVARFQSSLKASLSHWAREGKKGVWIKVPLQQAKLVPVAIEEGFWYHHAEVSYVMLVYWIPQTLCTLPANTSHQVGICAFVFNDQGEVVIYACIYKECYSDSEIIVQEAEVTAVQWMTIKEFVGQPRHQESNLLKQMLEVCVARVEEGYKGFSAVQTPSKFNGHQAVFYCNVLDLET